MRKINYLIIVLIALSCSTTRITESWRNPEYKDYQPNKVLILGVTPNLTARKTYEEKLKTVLIKKGIDAAESQDIFKTSFTSLKQSEVEIQEQIDTLSKKGFDAILVSAVKGYDERISFGGDLHSKDDNLMQFGNYYYSYQDVYFDEENREEYRVYHIEISLYDIINDTEKSLVWVASYDVIDPQKINATIKDCVNAIVESLEEEGIIPED